jgi:NAD(P)-dependent dehydrogenase (short-subunit alcohol dehydrogenase family)
MSNQGRLDGKRIIVTGAAGGIGEAIARRCVEEGARTALVDVDPTVHDVASSIDSHAFVGDVADDAFVTATVAQLHEEIGGLEGLANVAGIQRSGDAVELDRADWDLTLAVNLTAPYLWARAVIPVMLAGAGGSIVNITSIAATHAIRNSPAYVASKHGLLGFTRSVATDFGRRGIRSNAVSPGSIETELLTNYMAANPEAGARLIDANFTGRLGQTSEIAACCAYLFGDDAGFVNGANFCVDGGRTAAT